ncbi:aminopeptidase N [Nocardioides sp. T2.26MG-1]|uniref:aminopeptidase N n=1 Tax=Nocardioides sp. T2.26MG-1 TaxID=3041166 RepID=UPI0024776E18|nr:aminopeptidase N [Nocardioides sp. T2.26MG-1]CAI9398838.1 Aminopeptidase N [Nocardioides sp. T2.26MG-1]
MSFSRSLTLAEARARAAAISEVSYAVDLDLTSPAAGTFGCRTRVRFTTSAPETFLELTAATDLSVTLDGRVVPPAYDGRRLRLSGLAGAHELVVAARLPYVTDGDGMHRMTDPADGATYVGAYLGMDIAQKVFCCFDQNDVKAPIALTVRADPGSTVLANGRTLSSPSESEAGEWSFAPTPPIPPALFVVAAGPWVSRRWEHAGLPFGWHARASLAAELDRDAEELRAITEGCFDHYARIFTEPYPFDSFDQVFVPGLNWGAQEMPGCVTYRDEYLPRGAVPEDLRMFRAAVIAHEMSHMWFGDLVTMTWWEDTWLQESFADYMGYRVAADGAGFPGALLGHEALRKPGAYDADERRSTHPVAPDAEDVPDVDSAATIFDSISYAKGNSVLRQLVTWLGDETFLRGVNTYLTRHRFANATLEDFVAALDEASDRDVREWVRLWLRTTGFDTVRVQRGGPDGTVPVLHRDGVRPHRLRVTAYDDSWAEVGSELVDLGDEPVPLPAFAGRVVVANSHGETFARVVLDPASRAAVGSGLCRVDDDLTRAVLWTMLFDETQTRALDPLAFVDVVERHLAGERSASLVSAVLSRTLDRVLPLRVPAGAAATTLDGIASACETGLMHACTPELALAFASGFAATSREAATLTGWLESGRVGELPLSPALRWRAVRRLAETGAADAAFVEEQRLREPGVEAELGAAAALAARPTEQAKAEAWAAAADPDVDNRRFGALVSGLWSAEQAGLLAPYVDRYLREAPGWAGRGQAFAQVVGRARPALALDAAQVAALEQALKGDLPTVLRRQWEDWRDDLS